MKLAAAIAFGMLLTSNSEARADEPRFILDRAAEGNRELLIQALEILERRCPDIRLDWTDVVRVPDRPRPELKVRLQPDPPLSIAPNRNAFGWSKMVEVAAPPFVFSIGGGWRPGIASRPGAGHKGAELCGPHEQHGEWSFHAVPELRILDRLR